MARRRSNQDKALTATVTTLAVGAGAYLLYYLLSGAGSKKDAPLIPNSIEKHLDAIVDALNQEFGNDWVNFGIRVLEAALSKALPRPVVALISTVHQAEQIGVQQGLSGSQKKYIAMRLVQARGQA